MKWFNQNNMMSTIPITYAEKIRQGDIVYETVRVIGKVKKNDLLKLIDSMNKIQQEVIR